MDHTQQSTGAGQANDMGPIGRTLVAQQAVSQVDRTEANAGKQRLTDQLQHLKAPVTVTSTYH